MEKKKYKCICVSGGGTEQVSYWNVQIMPKTMKLACVGIDSIWGSAEEEQVFRVNLSKGGVHTLRIWEKDLSDFTLYPNRAGTPYHFVDLDKTSQKC